MEVGDDVASFNQQGNTPSIAAMVTVSDFVRLSCAQQVASGNRPTLSTTTGGASEKTIRLSGQGLSSGVSFWCADVAFAA
nr:hypothetical protein [Rhizobium laguerreae]